MEGYTLDQIDELCEAIEAGKLGSWRIGRIQWCHLPNRPGGYWVWLTYGLGTMSLELPCYQPLAKVRKMTRFGEQYLARRAQEPQEQDEQEACDA